MRFHLLAYFIANGETPLLQTPPPRIISYGPEVGQPDAPFYVTMTFSGDFRYLRLGFGAKVLETRCKLDLKQIILHTEVNPFRAPLALEFQYCA